MKKIISLLVTLSLTVNYLFAGNTIISSVDYRGIAGHWTLNSHDYNNPTIYGVGQTDSLTAVNSPSSVNGYDRITNSAISFNGSNQCLTQTVYDIKQGQVTASMVDGTSFINDSSRDFSPYVGVSGVSKPYMLVATDSAGKKAWGYIGEQGTGGIGDNLLLNPTFDINTTSWEARSDAILSSVAGGQSGNCLELKVGAVDQYGYATQSITTVVGQVYVMNFWHKNGTSAGYVTIGSTGKGTIDIYYGVHTDAAWTFKSLFFTARTTTAYIRIGNNTKNLNDTSLYDEISVKSVGGETLSSDTLEGVGAFTDWTDDNPNGWTVSTEDGTNYVTENPADQCQLLNDKANWFLTKTNIGSAYGLYKYNLDINAITGAINMYVGGGGTISGTGAIFLTIGTKTGYKTLFGTNSLLFFKNTNCNVTFDNVVIQQVLTPTAAGVKIYSTKTGSTQSWAGIETNFNANAISSYEIRKSDFQITGALTVGCWIKAGVQTSKFIFDKYDTGSNYRSWGLCINENQYPVFNISNNGSDIFSAIRTSVITDNLWHFWTGVYTPSTSIKLYIDGVLVNANTTSIPSAILDTSVMLLVGAYQSAGVKTGFFTGSIDEPFIYGRALSDTEISNLYAAQKKTFIAVNSSGITTFR